MKYWIGSSCLAAFVLYLAWPAKEEILSLPPDMHVIEAEHGNGFAVITPDPFFDQEGWDIRIWRVDVHARIGQRTVYKELHIRAASISEETIGFVETAWGTELHILEAHPDMGPGQTRRRRWIVRSHGLEEVQSARGFGPFT